MGKTTAYRSVLEMRKLGYIAECVEHRQGIWKRIDLFSFADVLAYKAGEPAILIQAYHRKEEENHKHLLPETNLNIKAWLKTGNRMEHHLWHFKTKNKRKYWELERRNIVPV